MKTIKQTYTINASANKVWKALTDAEYINNWGGGPAKMDDKVGTRFTLWKGEIFGQNLEVIDKKKLVQQWWSKQERWDEESRATFNLSPKNGKIVLELIHENVPDKDAKNIADGWKQFYLGPLKKFLEK